MLNLHRLASTLYFFDHVYKWVLEGDAFEKGFITEAKSPMTSVTTSVSHFASAFRPTTSSPSAFTFVSLPFRPHGGALPINLFSTYGNFESLCFLGHAFVIRRHPHIYVWIRLKRVPLLRPDMEVRIDNHALPCTVVSFLIAIPLNSTWCCEYALIRAKRCLSHLEFTFVLFMTLMYV